MNNKQQKLDRWYDQLRTYTWFREQEPDKKLVSIGAIVCANDGDAASTAQQIADTLHAERIELPKDRENFSEKVLEINTQGRSLVITLLDDLANMQSVLEILRQINDYNDVSADTATTVVHQHVDTRFVVVFSRETWEKQSWSNFTDLFGIICRLDD